MLVDSTLLRQALDDFQVRNQLIRTLDNTANSDPLKAEQLVLSLWLGSSSLQEQITTQPKLIPINQILFNLYYCFLILERQILRLNQGAQASSELSRCREAMIFSYNENPNILILTPTQFIERIISLLKSIAVNEFEQTERHQVENAIQMSIDVLAIKNEHELSSFKKRLFNTHPRSQIITHFNQVFIGMAITREQIKGQIPLTCPNRKEKHLELRATKQFFRARDNIVLDGLYFTHPCKSPYLVIALLGQRPCEHRSTWEDAHLMATCFGVDTLFFNHRNYSVRSIAKAQIFNDLVDDIVDVVQQFIPEKIVVLYGYCGGGNLMIGAAEQLWQKNIPFKLIVDRSVQRYRHFTEISTVFRHGLYLFEEHSPLSIEHFFILLLNLTLKILFLMMVQLLIRSSHLDYDFGAMLRKLPLEDVLTLEGKGAKEGLKRQRAFIDVTIHPKNNARHALQKQRTEQKLFLFRFNLYCSKLIDAPLLPSSLRPLFTELRSHVWRINQLIENEKLTFRTQAENQPKELHHDMVFDLTTRHQLPVVHLIQGFFKAEKKQLPYLSQLKTYSTEEIFYALTEDQEEYWPLAENIAYLLEDIEHHKTFLNYMGNRMRSTYLGDIDATFKKLLSSPFFERVNDIQHISRVH